MWWNAISLVSMIMVPGGLAAVALAGAMHRSTDGPVSIDRSRGPEWPWARGG